MNAIKPSSVIVDHLNHKILVDGVPFARIVIVTTTVVMTGVAEDGTDGTSVSDVTEVGEHSQNLIEKIARNTVTDYYDADIYIRRDFNDDWQVQVVGGCKDTYVERAEDPKVTHYKTTATLSFDSTSGESLDALLRRALDFVKTETPVPA